MVAGAVIGVKAFFAALAFVLCCGVVMCGLAMIATVVKLLGNDDKEGDKDD